MTDECNRLVLQGEGELAADVAVHWRGELLHALERGAPAAVDLEAASEIGLPVFQLILAAKRSFQARGLAFELIDPRGLWSGLGARAGVSGLRGA